MDSPIVKSIIETKLPTSFGTFNMRAYPSGINDFPHLALFTEGVDPINVIDVRIHSECMTGDVFSSAKCDCGDQLNYSMEWVQKNQGVVIYLRQEGRGIGLIKKLEAYNLQEEGYNTLEANLKLGFHGDQRNYDVVVSILEDLNINKIRLLTNNPEKVDAFEHSSIEVVERLPIEVIPNETNIGYLRTKKEDMGHLFSNFE